MKVELKDVVSVIFSNGENSRKCFKSFWDKVNELKDKDGYELIKSYAENRAACRPCVGKAILFLNKHGVSEIEV